MPEWTSVAVQYSLPTSLPEWELPEVPVPESPEHDEMSDRLRSVLVAWLTRTGRAGAIRRNLAIRWDRDHPRVGVDPDVCWVNPIPPGFEEGELDSLRLWLPFQLVPPLAMEIVSRSHPYKDYGRVQDKYAAVGVQELWVYDPRRFGPKALGGPVFLQLWARTPEGVLVCQHHADSPVRSPLLGAWLVPQPADHLLIAEHADGSSPWLSLAEQEHQRAEHERQRADALAEKLTKLGRHKRR
jgi:Uma2 family endonuclease